MVKLRRITLYRILPIILLSVLLFSICICSNVFSPKPARAIVGEEFIVPAFYAWLNTMNVYLSTYDSSPSDTQYLSNGIWNSLVNVANTQNWLSSAAWTLATLAVELENRISTAFDNNGNGFFQLDGETSTLFDSATRQFIIDNSLSSDVQTPVEISAFTGIMLSSGLELKLVPIGTTPPSSTANQPYTLLSTNIEYELNTGHTFEIWQSLDSTTQKLYVDDVEQSSIGTGNKTYLYYYLGQPELTESGTKRMRVRRYNSNGTGYSSLGWISNDNLYDILTNANGTYGYEATTGTIVQNPTLPDDNEDEYGFVGVPNGVAWGASTTGAALIQSMLDYERDKPYSSTSEYTYTISNEVPIQPEPEEPGMVELPLIGIQLPANFSLNLKGIWYYVVQWVNSIRAWMSWMFGVFANLPYAMVVPIYATAVVVIVLGVYKRFFM